MRAAQGLMRAELEQSGFHPCLWCGGAIGEKRIKDALLRAQVPKYCDDACRRNDPHRSLVNRILLATYIDTKNEAEWFARFRESIEAATK